jgi:hypothetical protein
MLIDLIGIYSYEVLTEGYLPIIKSSLVLDIA